MQRLVLKKEPRLDAKHRAFPYQREAAEAIRDLPYAAVFHEQGLGKTKIAIDIMLYWLEKKVVDTVLIVAKKGLIENWRRELTQHTWIHPRLLSGNKRANFYAFNSPARVLLAHYEIFRTERGRMALFLKTRSVAAVLDESAKIKNPDSALTKDVLSASSLFKRKLILTGTPVANRPYDLWSQIYFLDGGESLGKDFRAFRRRNDLSNNLAHDTGAQADLETSLGGLFRHLSKFVVRETKASGIIELPEKTYETITTDWEQYQLDLYSRVRDELRAAVIRDGIPVQDSADNLLKRLLRLTQIASNPRLVDDSYAAVPGKYDSLALLVSRILYRREKVIIWTAFTDNVDWLAHQLKSHGTCRLHGKMAMEARTKSIDRFLEDETTRVMVATPSCAKEGLTLTVANHVIFFDRTFSLDDFLQAQDRIHRISQKKKCFVYTLVMPDSIDEWVDALLNAKRLAAQLAQGDISMEFYRSQISYEFGDILKHILGMAAPAGKE